MMGAIELIIGHYTFINFSNFTLIIWEGITLPSFFNLTLDDYGKYHNYPV